MEKKILMSDVINLVKESIKRKFRIECAFRSIIIYNKEKEIDIIQGHNNSKEVLVIRTTNLGKTEELELSEEDVLKWKLLEIECNNYQNDIAIKEFNNFFDDEDFKPTTINDLDSEDD